MFCTNCGTEYKEGQKFCAGCGSKLTSSAPAAPTGDLQTAGFGNGKNRALKTEILKNFKMQNAASPDGKRTAAAEIFVGSEIPLDRCKNAINAYALGVSPDEVICLFDETLFHNGKEGLLFTVDSVFMKGALSLRGAAFLYSEKPYIKRNTFIYKYEGLNKLFEELYEADIQGR